MIRRPAPWAVGVALGLALAVLVTAGFAGLREPLFERLAAGTRWVLVVCGFEAPDGTPSAGSQRLRRLYYAMRMFEDVPPERLSADDAWADARYPGMGFGLLRTFDRRPVRVVLGGWRYLVPCVYFADARDCRRADLRSVRLKVRVPDMEPRSRAHVETFLAVAAPDIAHLTAAARDAARDAWPTTELQTATTGDSAGMPAGFRAYVLPTQPAQVLWVGPGSGGSVVHLVCTRRLQAQRLGIQAQCRDRFAHGPDVTAELRYDADLAGQWAALRTRAWARLDTFLLGR